MQFTTSACLVLALALSTHASIIQLIPSAGLAQRTININGINGVQGTILSAATSGNLVLASPSVIGGQSLIVGNPWGAQTLVAAGGLVPSAIQVAAPTVVQAVNAEA